MKQEINNLLWIGTVVNTHGVKGEVRVLSDSKNATTLFSKGNTLKYIINNEIKCLKITSSRPHKNFMLLTFDGINNINEIEWLKGFKVYCDKEKLNDGEYYLQDLIDKCVYDQNNNLIGTVVDVVDQGPYDNLIIKLENNKSTNIPIVDEFNIKFKSNKVMVNLPDNFIN